MEACLLNSAAPIETQPLDFTHVPDPQPTGDQVRVRVSVCGVCRTDLHVVEGELPPRKSPVIPGHQVVGVVEKIGDTARLFELYPHVRLPRSAVPYLQSSRLRRLPGGPE